jgi:hypothetical protein
MIEQLSEHVSVRLQSILAQLVERLSLKQKVMGSIPILYIKKAKTLTLVCDKSPKPKAAMQLGAGEARKADPV